MRYYKNIIIGATAFGIGKACSLNSNSTLLIESGMICAHEFTASYKTGTICNLTSLSAYSEKLVSKAKACNLLYNGKLSLPSVSGILAEMLLESQADVMLNTEISDIKKSDNGFLVTVFSKDGFETVFSENILDTSSKGTLHSYGEKLPYIVEYAAAVTKTANTDIDSSAKYSDAVLEQCRFDSEYIFSVSAVKEDYIASRKKLHSIWQKYTENLLCDFELDMTASEFKYSLPESFKEGYSVNVTENFIFSPSCAFNNILSAFEKGSTL